MLATATHDHKRGEDVRARLAVLSEMADEWAQRCSALGRAMPAAAQRRRRCPTPAISRCCCRRSSAPGRSTSTPTTATGRAAFAERLAALAAEGAARGQARHRLGRAERGLRGGGARLLLALVADDALPDLLRRDRRPSSQRIAPAGAVNGLAQTLLKLTAPGVPDLYQGTESGISAWSIPTTAGRSISRCAQTMLGDDDRRDLAVHGVTAASSRR